MTRTPSSSVLDGKTTLVRRISADRPSQVIPAMSAARPIARRSEVGTCRLCWK
jgi:hypothetical protein